MSSASADFEVVNTFLPWEKPKNFPGLTPLHSRNNSPSSLEGEALRNFFADKNEEGRDDEMSAPSEDAWLRACELLRDDNDDDDDDEPQLSPKLPRVGSPMETDAREDNFDGPGRAENVGTKSVAAYREGRGEPLLVPTASVDDLFTSLTDDQKKILGDKWLDKFGKLRLHNMVRTRAGTPNSSLSDTLNR